MSYPTYYKKKDYHQPFFPNKRVASSKIIYERKDGKPLNFREDYQTPTLTDVKQVTTTEPTIQEIQSTDTSCHAEIPSPLAQSQLSVSSSDQFTLGETFNTEDTTIASQQSVLINENPLTEPITTSQLIEKSFSPRNYKKWLKKQVIAENLRIKKYFQRKILDSQQIKKKRQEAEKSKILEHLQNSSHSSMNEKAEEEKNLLETPPPLSILPQIKENQESSQSLLPPPLVYLVNQLFNQFMNQEKTLFDIIASLTIWGEISRIEVRTQLLINQTRQRNYYLNFKLQEQRRKKEQIEKELLSLLYLGTNFQFSLIKSIIILKIEVERLIQIRKRKLCQMNNSSSFEKISSLSKQQRSLIQERISTRVKELSQNRRTNLDLIQSKVNSLISLISTVIDEVSINEIALLQNLMDYTEKDPIWKKDETQTQSTNCSKVNQPLDQSFKGSVLANISCLYDNSQDDSSLLDMRSKIWEPTGSKLHSDLNYQEKATLQELMQKELEGIKTPISYVKRKLFSSVIDFFSTQQIAEISWKETLKFLDSSAHMVLDKYPPGDIVYFEFAELTSPHQRLYLVCDLSKTDELKDWLDGQMIKEILVPPQFSRTSSQISIAIDKKSARQVLNQMILALPINLEQVPARATKFYSNFTLPVASSEQIYEFQQNLLNRKFEKVVSFYDQYFNQLSRIAGNAYTMIISNSINPYQKSTIITLSKPIQLEPGKGQYIDTQNQTEQRFYIEQYNVRETDIVLFPKCCEIQATLKNAISLDPISQFITFSTKIWIENKSTSTVRVKKLPIEINL